MWMFCATIFLVRRVTQFLIIITITMIIMLISNLGIPMYLRDYPHVRIVMFAMTKMTKRFSMIIMMCLENRNEPLIIKIKG